MSQSEKRTPTSSNSITVVYPSPVLIAGPLAIAISLVAGGVARGTLLPRHSTPALLLMVLSYLFSRWYRRAAVVFGADSVAFGEKSMHYRNITRVKAEREEQGARCFKVLNFYDGNGVKRLSIHLGAYGFGLNRIHRELRDRLPSGIVDPLTTRSVQRRVLILWFGVGVLCLSALIEGFLV
jgi:hypothetical protein